MKLSMLVSPGTWDLVDRLRPHLDVTIDLFDAALNPALPERADPVAQQVRRLARELSGVSGSAVPAGTPRGGPGANGGVRQRFATALRTGNSQLFTAEGLRVGLFPLRHDRASVGLLVVSAPVSQRVAEEVGEDDEAAPPVPAEQAAFAFFSGVGTRPLAPDAASPGPAPRLLTDPVSRKIERIGWSLRATIEADIETHERLSDEQHRSRWLSTTLKFLEHLHACETDEEMADALVQAAAIWGDVDARLYRRDLTGDLALHTALPAVAAEAGPRVLPAALLSNTDVVRVSSIAELEQMGWRGQHAEVMLMPVPSPDRTDWLLAVGGSVDARFERVLGVACRTLGSRLAQAQAQRADALRARLVARLREAGASVPAQAASLLAEVAVAAGATQARLLAHGPADGPPHVLAAVGGATGRTPRAAGRTPTSLVLPLDVGLARPAMLELLCGEHEPFTLASAELAEAGAQVIGPWLSGALRGLAAAPAAEGAQAGGFESRIAQEIERARRFGFEAGLLVIDTTAPPRDRHDPAQQAMIEAVRGQLRASDSLGRLSTGELAILLVQTNAAGAALVARRVARVLAPDGEGGAPTPRIGLAAYPKDGETVAALVAAAKQP